MTRIVHEGIAEIAGIKINRVGGLTKARRLRDMALAHGMQIYVMATGGSVMADTEASALPYLSLKKCALAAGLAKTC